MDPCHSAGGFDEVEAWPDVALGFQKLRQLGVKVRCFPLCLTSSALNILPIGNMDELLEAKEGEKITILRIEWNADSQSANCC